MDRFVPGCLLSKSRFTSAARDSTAEIVEDQLRRLHWNQGLSLHQMANMLGMNRRSLVRTMVRLGVPRRSYSEAMQLIRRPPPLTKEELSEMYLARHMSRSQISQETGVSA